MKGLTSAVLIMFAAWNALAAEDCALAERYYTLAKAANEEYRSNEAFEFLERATAACSRYDYWVALGETATEIGDADLNGRAAEAFSTAYEVAESPRQEAYAIAKYAELQFHSGDPQGAFKNIHEARNLDPDNAWIAEMANTIDDRYMVATADDIKRGLGDVVFAPLQLRRNEPVAPIVTEPTGGGGSGRAPAEPAPIASPVERRSVNIAINFETGRTIVDDKTRGNLEQLAKALADPEMSDSRFLFIGHADQRGDSNANRALSLRRAMAVADEVVALQPNLAGRIRAEGKGEDALISRGFSERDHWVNRRLEVVIE